MTPEAEDRLRSHVGSIVDAGSVPRADLDDLAEEMLGHLIERVEADVAGGTDEDEAVRTATADFGDVVMIGGELGRTYHSRLWASTVGVLLTARDAPGERPGVVRALRFLLALDAVLVGLAAVLAIISQTPLHALLEGAACLLFVVSACLAYRGLGVGQRWALRFAVGAMAVLVFEGVVPGVPTPPGTTMIPVFALAAAVTLLWVGSSADAVRSFVAGSRSIGRPLAVALALAVVMPTLVVRAMPAIPDPTQATAGDAALSLSMTCGRRDSVVAGSNRQFATLVADVAFRHADVLPLGLVGQLDRSDAADSAGFRIVDPPQIKFDNGGPMPAWLLDDGGEDVRVVETGEVAGWFGASSTSVNLLPDTIGSFTVGVEPDRIAANRTIRITWTIIPTRDGDQPWPRAEVAYAHLDRFLIDGTVGCGEHSTGAPVPGATSHPEGPGFLPG